jgi:serine/threonine protein kinase
MGAVYLAEDTALGRKVALKLLAPELAADERFRERFLRESKLAASLDHRGIVPIYQAGESDGTLFIAMRYVEGSDLRSVLGEGPLEPARAIAILEQVADALDAAHAGGLVHRDVKPENILLDTRGHAYLSDFGLTKQASSQSGLTQTGQLVGTLDYVAPEQIEGREVDGRADVYSLTCVLYECLTGAKPFARESEVATLWAHINELPPTSGDAALDAVVVTGMAKRPQDRYRSAAERWLGSTRKRARSCGQSDSAFRQVTSRRRRTFVWVADGTHGTVSRIDPRTNLVARSIRVFHRRPNPGGGAVPHYPSAIAAGTASVWANAGTTRVVRITPGFGSSKVELDIRADALAFGFGALWVLDRDSAQIARVPDSGGGVSTISLGARGEQPAGRP